MSTSMFIFFFFFQAEDGIRDKLVTGVQTCALPICVRRREAGVDALVVVQGKSDLLQGILALQPRRRLADFLHRRQQQRSEERRVGEEGRSRWSPDHLKKKKEKVDRSKTVSMSEEDC